MTALSVQITSDKLIPGTPHRQLAQLGKLADGRGLLCVEVCLKGRAEGLQGIAVEDRHHQKLTATSSRDG